MSDVTITLPRESVHRLLAGIADVEEFAQLNEGCELDECVDDLSRVAAMIDKQIEED